MGSVIYVNVYQAMWDFFRTLFRIDVDFDCGTIDLIYGKWILYFDTVETPANVWINVCEDDSIPVCGGSSTLVGASPTDRGLWMYADVRSNNCTINWFVSKYV